MCVENAGPEQIQDTVLQVSSAGGLDTGVMGIFGGGIPKERASRLAGDGSNGMRPQGASRCLFEQPGAATYRDEDNGAWWGGVGIIPMLGIQI